MLVSRPKEKRGSVRLGRTSEEMPVLEHATEVDKSDKHCASGSLIPLWIPPKDQNPIRQLSPPDKHGRTETYHLSNPSIYTPSAATHSFQMDPSMIPSQIAPLQNAVLNTSRLS